MTLCLALEKMTYIIFLICQFGKFLWLDESSFMKYVDTKKYFILFVHVDILKSVMLIFSPCFIMSWL